MVCETQTLISYESLLERDRLWLADFDPNVRWIASQPFWLSGRVGSILRRHPPDFLLQTTTGYTVVDVKPEPLLGEPGVGRGPSVERAPVRGEGLGVRGVERGRPGAAAERPGSQPRLVDPAWSTRQPS